MSDHAWVQEQIATAVAGGLTPEETERFDAHVLDCRDCAAALDEARTLGRKLQALFAPDRPSPALEDRAIQALRADTARRRLRSGWRRKLELGIAASLGVVMIGGGVSLLSVKTAYLSPDDLFAAANTPAPEEGLWKYRSYTSAQEDRDKARLRGFDHPSGLSLSQGIPDVSNTGYTNHVPSADANRGYFTNWGTSAYAGGGQVNLQVDQSVIDGGPGRAGGAATTPRSPADNTINNGLSNKETSPNSWAASSYAANYQVFGTVNNLSTNSNPASGFGTWDGPIFNVGKIPNVTNNSIFFGEQFSPPAYPGQVVTYPESKSGASLGYIKPSDIGGQLPNPKESLSGKKESLKRLAGGGATGIQTSSDNPPPPPTAPVVPILPSVQDATEGKKGGEQAPAEKSNPPAKPAAPAPTPTAPAEPAGPRKIVIRSGDMEFEVESFDSAVAAVTQLVTAIDGAFVATVNSEKLPNGKVKGSVVLRVPPERLDALVLDLRKELGKAGELKGQRIGSQDITKQYTDLESRLKAARTMEQRLLQIIKEGKGEIKQLLEVEKELGVWRTRIEEAEGELRYYGHLVALSTLTVTLAEREIRSAVTTTERERVQAGVEVEDVDKTLQDALAAVAEAKGRVTKSELKQLAAGQFNATLHCELAPLAAGPFRDRLKQLGRVARLEIDRVLQSEGGTPVHDAKVTRGDTQFLLQFYNLANVAPRETTTALVAVPEVPAAYHALREAIDKAKGRVLTSQLDEQDRLNVTARLDFEVRRADEAALLAALNAAGEVVSRNVARAADGDNLTDSKMLFRTALVSAERVKPRETTTLTLEVADVDATVAVFGALVAEAKGRTADSQATHERGGRDTAKLAYDVPLSAASALVEKFKSAGVVRAQNSARDLQAPDGRFATARLDVTLANMDPIVARDDGLWPQVRRGLSVSVAVLLTSVTWIVFGLCVVLPWAAVGYGGYRVFRRLAPRPAVTPPAPPPVPPSA